MPLQLVVYEGNLVVRKVPMADQLVIGRGADSSLQLTDASVSTRHARIVQEGGLFQIEDLGSHNKTVIQGGPTLSKGQRAPLRAGMKLSLGRVLLGVEGEPVPMAKLTDLAGLEQTAQDMDLTLQPGADEAPMEATLVPSVAKPAPRPPPLPPAAKIGHALVPAESGTIVPDSPDPALVAHAFMKGLQPRLIVDNDVLRKVVELSSGDFTIGSREGSLTINHPMVSKKHARIFYDARRERLFLEDLRSANSTFLNGEVLIANVPRELPQQAHLRFGTVDALFVMEKNYDGETMHEERAQAVEMLLKSKKLDPQKKKKAEEDAKRSHAPLEAELISAAAVTVPQWVKALADARIAIVTNRVTGHHTRRLRLWIAVLGLALLGLLALYLAKLL